MTKNNKLALGSNILLIVLAGLGLFFSIVDKNAFLYYSDNAGMFALSSSIIYVIVVLTKKEPNFLSLALRYVSTTCLVLTLVGTFYVATTTGENYLDSFIKGSHLFNNLLCPIVSFVSFTMFEGDRRLNKKKTIWYALIPTVIYGIIMLVCNVSNTFTGPYSFMMINDNPVYVTVIVFIVTIILNYVIGRFLLLSNQKHAPRRKKAQ
ncbi:MAG: hypothetical protein PUD31_03325 [Solobacterium sp.]|nr:hypothetical protein [Solobacterium sp.]MDY2953490.1 hypothetical protein [Erysipelotrichaceae bacterium]MCI6845802.1 hypothetical protein [Solobacterium sp.]MCI6878289.1 hypothetical protein [Solobacterium sp.]MDD5801441.1 hypothetical protein [Solobacterium sp.]